jgi:hypothetical protein
MLELPQTIRSPKGDEIPKGSKVEERLKEQETANIVEGYNILDNKQQENSLFNFYAEININNSRLWDLIVALQSELPEVAALIFGHHKVEPFYGEYIMKELLIKELAVNKNELTKDPFIEWGLIFSDKTKLIEIFISESKYIKFWGNDKTSFQKIMETFKLKETPTIEFIDQYPKVREPLKNFEKNVVPTNDLIESFIQKYINKQQMN